MRTSNPVLNANVFSQAPKVIGTDAMTINGTVAKTGIMLALLSATAIWTWGMFYAGQDVTPFAFGGAILGFIVALVTIFKKEWAPVTAPVYALIEGVVLGGISAIFEAKFPGIVIQAVFLTFGTLFGLLAAYQSGMIKVTDNFRLGVVAATGGIALVYLATWVLGMFNVPIPYIHEGGMIGIGFSLLVIVVASLNLVLDFDFIEGGAQQGAPKYMEWYGAFGLMITLIWLYTEFLRLLSKLQRRD